MVTLKKITAENVWKIMKLRVNEEQENFVASNSQSVIEAYVALTNGGHALPYGIYDDETPVGFLMIGYDGEASWEDAPQIAQGNYSLWRLMIDRNYQQRGYGKEAIRLALELMRTFPFGPAEYCWLSYEPENEVAKKLYRSFGFEENGEKDEDEIIAVRKL